MWPYGIAAELNRRKRRSLGSGLGHFRHEPHENPATELAELPAIQAIPWDIASCPNQDDLTGPIRRADMPVLS